MSGTCCDGKASGGEEEGSVTILDAATLSFIHHLWSKGLSTSEIAGEVPMTEAEVYNALSRYREGKHDGEEAKRPRRPRLYKRYSVFNVS